MSAIGIRKKTRAEDVDPGLRRARTAAGDDVDAHVLVVQQRVAGAQQEDRREQVPLDLEQRVRAHVERLADDRVGGADQAPRPAPASMTAPADALVESRRSRGTGRAGLSRGPPYVGVMRRRAIAGVIVCRRRSSPRSRDYSGVCDCGRAHGWPAAKASRMLKSSSPYARGPPCSIARITLAASRPGALGRHRRREPAAGRPHRADRVGELREPARCWRRRARSSPTSTPRAIPASATTAAASSSTSPSSSRSTARRSCSAPMSPTCSRIRARRRTRRCSSRRSSPATRSSACACRTAAT